MINSKDLFTMEDLKTAQSVVSGLIAIASKKEDAILMIRTLELIAQEISINNL